MILYTVVSFIIEMKRYVVNVRESALQPPEKPEGIYKSTGLHKAFNKGGILIRVKSSNSPHYAVNVFQEVTFLKQHKKKSKF